MEDRELIDELRQLKMRDGYTLYELSKEMDVPITTLQRWFKTNRINRMYAHYLKERIIRKKTYITAKTKDR